MRAFGAKAALKNLDEFTMAKDWPIPEPGAGEIRVRVHAASINPVDWKIAVGMFPGSFPRTVGCDGAGVVDAIGPDVADLKVGDRVVLHNDVAKPHGSLADYTICTAVTVAKIPDGITFEEAASVPCTGCTAYVALIELLGIQAGKTVLVTGGSGGVGSIGVALSKMKGLRVFTTVSAKNEKYARNLGADEIIDRSLSDEKQTERVLELTGGLGCDYVFDAVGIISTPEGAKLAASFLRFGGHACTTLWAAETSSFFFKGAALHFVFLGGHYSVKALQPHFRELLGAMMKLLSEGEGGKKLPSTVAKVVPFEEGQAAMKELAEGHSAGKIVLRLS